jgi:hypothetical protein
LLLIKHVKGDKYIAEATNIGEESIHTARFSFLEPEASSTFLISGIELKIINEIKPGEKVSFPLSIIFFDSKEVKSLPKIMIAAEEFLVVSEFSL